ncbi:hypothetical protein Nepgr_031773 [Nepenthes gracilis]|uniref:Uncharacterized protein n=1 Tax=Nepenthes gracilis TaxID=150966 RepID=A0AAD3THC8_NEPGR|nr:hypothetical protein Nepgr_031773 [Nepenthes gracilis]
MASTFKNPDWSINSRAELQAGSRPRGFYNSRPIADHRPGFQDTKHPKYNNQDSISGQKQDVSGQYPHPEWVKTKPIWTIAPGTKAIRNY